MFDKNHLHYCRMDLIELIDGLCVMTNKAENLPKELDIFKTKVLAELPHANPYEDPLHLEFLSKCDFVHENFDHYINGKKEADVIALPFKWIHERNHQIIDVAGDGNCLFYCFAIILKLEERDVSNEGKKVATSLQKELQDYFDSKVEDGDFKKLFLEHSDEERNRIKEENSGCEIEHYMLLLGNRVGNDNDLSELRDNLYHEDMEYVKHNPKVDKEELDNDTKNERIPDTDFVLKLFAMKYQITIAKVTVIHHGLMRDSAKQDANDYYIENGDDEGIQYYDLYIYNQDGTDATIYKRCQTLFDDDIMNECKYFVFTQPTYVPTFDGQNAFVDNNGSHHQLLAFLPDEEINANDDNKDDNEQEDDNAFENEIKITNFHCAAQDLCKHDKGAITEKCLTLTSRNINLCHVCNHYAHKKCTTRCKGSTKIVSSKGAKFICHLCKINEDGDCWPFVASKKFKDVVSDKAAQQLTVKALAFDSEENCKMTFQEMMRRTKKNLIQVIFQ